MPRSLIRSLAFVGALGLAGTAPAAADPSDSRIVGGSETSSSRYPWQVALALDDSFGSNGLGRTFCGGTLVAPTIVITAAHCVLERPSPFDHATNFEVFTGRTVLSSTQGQAIDVADLYYFEGSPAAPVLQAQSADPSPATGQLYNPTTMEWDAAFLRLEAPSTAGEPIKIAGPGEEATWAPGAPASISGWGRTSMGGSKVDRLRAATVSIIDDGTCGSRYASFLAPTMVCAGVLPQGAPATCTGDSGGPLAVPVYDPAAGQTARLVGDISFGRSPCGRPDFPDVYGRLASDPMRSAFQSGIQLVAGVNVVGTGAVASDRTAPETKITKHPKKHGTRKKAKFKFTANEPSTFQCSLDGKRYRTCSSPYKKKVSRGHRHRFLVRAIDGQGNADPSPESFRWTVRAR